MTHRPVNLSRNDATAECPICHKLQAASYANTLRNGRPKCCGMAMVVKPLADNQKVV